jgi:hypothetical protein
MDDFAKITKKLPYIGAAITGAMGYYDEDYTDAGYGGADRIGLGIVEGALELVDMLANLTGNGVDLITGRDDFGRADAAGAFKDGVTSDTWLRSFLTFGKPYEDKNTPLATPEDIAIANATAPVMTPSVVPPFLLEKPMREDFDSFWKKERKEEYDFKIALKEYNKQLADYIEKTEEQKQTVDNLQMKNLKDMETFRTESEKANQNLNTVLESFLNTAENQEKYSKQIAKNTGGLPSDVSANPTSTSRGRNAGRSGR